MLEAIVHIIFTVGLTMGVGSSTFALIFYIRALEDGVIDTSEKRFMQAVYAVLRISMILLGASLLGELFTKTDVIPQSEVLALLLGIITVNAILMTKRMMPMRFGPVLAGGSWYSILLVSEITALTSYGYLVLLALYLLFLTFFYVVFQSLKEKFTITKGQYTGEVSLDIPTRTTYATDASAFFIQPQAVYFPKNVSDVQTLVQKCYAEIKSGSPTSLTVRAGGTCMSGGPLNTGWIIDMTRHMKQVSIDPKALTATVEMGAYFRDIEEKAAKHNLMFAPYPSSRLICGIGGMIGNNASGEKSLRSGATSDNVLELEVVFADGTVERIRPKNIKEATSARERALLSIIEPHSAHMREVTGYVKKSASGYRFEKVVQGDIFNEIPLFVGSQGTLGIITKAVLKLEPVPKHTALLIISAQELKDISDVVNTVFAFHPEGLETFDSNTFMKAKEHLTQSAQKILPYIDHRAHLFILAQFSESTREATEAQAEKCLLELVGKKYYATHIRSQEDIDAAWDVRRHSFLLMRDFNEGSYRAVPCIEDVIVPLPALGTFVSKLSLILKKHKIAYGYHGHIGDGSLRIIPVFDFSQSDVSSRIISLTQEVFALVKKLKGNMSADHSDGIIRTPFLKEFYGNELYTVFEDIKKLYDSEHILNPHKKTDGTIALIEESLNTKK